MLRFREQSCFHGHKERHRDATHEPRLVGARFDEVPEIRAGSRRRWLRPTAVRLPSRALLIACENPVKHPGQF